MSAYQDKPRKGTTAGLLAMFRSRKGLLVRKAD